MSEAKTLMDALEVADLAAGVLEHELLMVMGGYEDLPMEDWWFDTYDASIELVDTKDGWEPSPELLAAFRKAGICQLWITYHSGKAERWGVDGRHGPCSGREVKRPQRRILQVAERRIRALEGAARGLAEAALLRLESLALGALDEDEPEDSDWNAARKALSRLDALLAPDEESKP